MCPFRAPQRSSSVVVSRRFWGRTALQNRVPSPPVGLFAFRSTSLHYDGSSTVIFLIMQGKVRRSSTCGSDKLANIWLVLLCKQKLPRACPELPNEQRPSQFQGKKQRSDSISCLFHSRCPPDCSSESLPGLAQLSQ